MQQQQVKCRCDGQTICLIPSVSKISQTWYHCIQYSKRHHMNSIPICYHRFRLKWHILACYLFLSWPELQPKNKKTCSHMWTSAKIVRLRFLDGAQHTQYSGAISVSISLILMEWGRYMSSTTVACWWNIPKRMQLLTLHVEHNYIHSPAHTENWASMP